MAIITKPVGGIFKGIPATITLNKSELAALSSVSSDSYFSVTTNWNRIILSYKSSEGNQKEIVEFNATLSPCLGFFDVSNTARNLFEIQVIKIIDFDGGIFIIPRSELITADFDVIFENNLQVSLSSLSYTTPVIYIQNQSIIGNIPTVTGTATSYSISPTLPLGLYIDSSTGVISGTPYTTISATNYTVTAYNSEESTSAIINIIVQQSQSESFYTYEEYSADNTNNYPTLINSYSYKCVKQSDNKLIIGGPFTSHDGITANGILRFNENGSIDSSFDTGVGFSSNVIWDMVKQSDDKILVAGVFRTYNGNQVTNIVRLNTNGSIDNTFNPPVTSAHDIFYNFNSIFHYGAIFCMLEQFDGKILIGGSFTTYGDTPNINHIVRLNNNGSLDESFNSGTGFNGFVHSVTQQSDGKLLIGGGFTSYNGTPCNGIVRLNNDGTFDNTFNIGIGFDYIVYSIKEQTDNKLVIAGKFTMYDGISANRIIRLNSNGSRDYTFEVGNGLDDTAISIAIQNDNKIVIGGDFTSYNGSASSKIVRLNTNGSIDTTFEIGAGFTGEGYGRISCVLIQSDGKIFVTGNFEKFNNLYKFKQYGSQIFIVNDIARLNLNGSRDFGF
jgi:uncharacterized delta-60 repeat protein